MSQNDALIRPATPAPNAKRTLYRTTSCASLDTICPPKRNRSIRRSISEISEITVKKKHSDDAGKNATDDKATSKVKAKKDTKKAIQDGPDKLHGGDSEPADEDREDDLCPGWSIERRVEITADGRMIFRLRQTSKVDIKDIQLDIQPYESNMTIWDGLQVSHHLYKCRLFLRCTAYPYDSVSISPIRLIEMCCKTSPILGSRYALPVLQTTYQGASPKKRGGTPDVKLTAGIHIDKSWRIIQEEDGTWGWYRDVYIPLPSRLFDKIDYREFKLISRVWLGQDCLESELTFGVSMLLREVEMK